MKSLVKMYTKYVAAYFVNDRDEEKKRKSIKVGMISL